MTPLKDEEEIRESEARRFRAMVQGDIIALDQIFSDDLSYAHAGGLTQTKTELLGSIQSGELKCKSFDASDIKVRVYEASATVTGIAQINVKFMGREGTIKIRYLDVYVKERGQWRMVAWQSARLPR
jgi:hypothetical protein